MLKGFTFLLVLSLVLFFAPALQAHVFLVGFSGAPGTYGVCGSSCHGYPGGTIYVDRFPVRYQPGQTYCIAVKHNAGDSIENFNCSIRVGRGSVNAGLITAGYETETYNDTVETNGVRAIERCDTCNFYWTAPPIGTDTVRLYLGGFQGIEGEWGYNTEFILASEELTGVEEQEALPRKEPAFELHLAGPNPARGTVALAYNAEVLGTARLRVYDLAGRLLRSYVILGKAGLLRWDGRDASGCLMPEGIYLFRLEQGFRTVTSKALLLR